MCTVLITAFIKMSPEKKHKTIKEVHERFKDLEVWSLEQRNE